MFKEAEGYFENQDEGLHEDFQLLHVFFCTVDYRDSSTLNFP